MAQDDFGLHEPAHGSAIAPWNRVGDDPAEPGLARLERLVRGLASVLGLVREDRCELARAHGPLRAIERLQELVEHAALCSATSFAAASPRLLPQVCGGVTGRRR